MNTTKKKITLVCQYTSLPGEGILTKLFYVGKYLSQQGYSVELIKSDQHAYFDTSRTNYNIHDIELSVKTIKTITYKKRGKNLLRIFSWIIFEIKVFLYLLFKSKSNFYLASSPSILTLLTVGIIAKIKKAKYIIDIRDIWPLTLIEEGGISSDNIFIQFMQWINKKSAINCDLLISSVPKISEYYKKKFKMDVNFQFLPICIDEENVNKKLNLNFSQINNTLLNIGYVGSIGRANNLDVFFEVAEKLSQNENVKFTIVGDGEFLPYYKEKYSHLPNLHFLGRVARSKINDFYASFDVAYISCSSSEIWRYGQSLNKLLSYMENAKPIIWAYPDHGYRSMVNESGCGFIIKNNSPTALEDCIKTCLELGNIELNKMGIRGQEWVFENRRYKTWVIHLDEKLQHIDKFCE